MKPAMASACLTGPPAYVAWQAGTTIRRHMPASSPSHGLRIRLLDMVYARMRKPWPRPVCQYPDYTCGIPRIIPAFPRIILYISVSFFCQHAADIQYARQISLHRGKLLISRTNIPNVAQLINSV
jgi:hypothetical protein